MTVLGDDIRVCTLANQYSGWDKIGGFGTMARRLAEGLASRSVEMSVIVPRRKGQGPVDLIAGVEVRSFPSWDILAAANQLRRSRATVFHSQEPTALSSLARRVRPRAVHIVTCRDPRDLTDWRIEFRDATWTRRSKIPLNYLLESSFIV
ncbi:MAG: glycosyltransferase family 4 protein [Candidatus Eisenbacteria bacterium]